MQIRSLICIMVTVLVFTVGIVSFAKAQAPTTIDELRSIIKNASETARKIKNLDDKLTDVNMRGQDLKKRIDDHNANICEYPEGHPEVCDWYVKEGKNLNDEGDALLKEYDECVGDRGMLRTHLQVQLARIRIAPFLDRLTNWQRRVIECSKIQNLDAAVECLNKAWEEHP